MSNKVFFAVIFTALLSACKDKQQENNVETPTAKTFYEIDLSKDFTGSNCNNMLLSDIVQDVKYIQLETTDNSLVECYPRTKYTISKNDIYALNTYSTEELFRFDGTTGKFISSIGQIGYGPEDMMNPSYIYAENDYVYASSSNHIYIYNKEGKHIKTIPAIRNGSTVSAISDEYLIYHPRQRPHAAENIFDKWTAVSITDFGGNILSSKVNTLQDITDGIYSLDGDPKRWYYDGQLHFFNEPDETVYAVTEEGIIPKYHFILGNNKWPIRAGAMIKDDIKYISFRSFKETTDYLYIYWNQNEKAYFARFSKKNGNLDVKEEVPFKGRFWHLYAYGPQNDIDGCGNYFGPIDIVEDKYGSIVFEINPNNIDRVREALEKAENIKFPEKRQQLLKMLDERKEDDNPILVIYKLKK